MRGPFLLHRRQWVPTSLDRVFGFFSDAANLEKLTPEWLRFQMRTPHVRMRQGARIDYQIRWHEVPLGWRTEIVCWEPPHRFEDLQLRGPYRLWHHIHRFAAVNGGTQLEDTVRYALPFGIIGCVMHSLMIRANIEEIFDYREKRIRELFGS